MKKLILIGVLLFTVLYSVCCLAAAVLRDVAQKHYDLMINDGSVNEVVRLLGKKGHLCLIYNHKLKTYFGYTTNNLLVVNYICKVCDQVVNISESAITETNIYTVIPNGLKFYYTNEIGDVIEIPTYR